MVGLLLFDVRCCCLLICVVCCLLCVVRCSLFVVCWLLSVVCGCSLLFAWCCLRVRGSSFVVGCDVLCLVY